MTGESSGSSPSQSPQYPVGVKLSKSATCSSLRSLIRILKTAAFPELRTKYTYCPSCDQFGKPTGIPAIKSDHLRVSKSKRTIFSASRVIATMYRPSGDQRGEV